MSWLSKLKKEAVSFLKGENNGAWAILVESTLGLVPGVGQVIDARDILKALVMLGGNPASPSGWFDLITALIGLIPGGGDAVKRSLRAVKAGALSLDGLFTALRKFGVGNPEKILAECLDMGRLRKYLDDMLLANPALRNMLDADTTRMLDRIRQNMQKQFDLFKKEVDGWIAKSRNNAAAAPQRKTTLPANPEKPKAGISGREGTASSKAKPDQAVKGSSPGSKASKLDVADILKTMGNKAIGILGEHMADFVCQQRWGGDARHDGAKLNPGKLNDTSELVQLWPSTFTQAGLAALRARGRGIDGVWRTGGQTGKPYAVVEAKASANPTRQLKDLLGDAADKEDSGGGKPGSGKKGGAKQSGSGSGGMKASSSARTSALSLPEKPQRQTDGRVTQMSKAWIKRRLIKAVGRKNLADDIADISGYSRHVLFFSIPHATGHAMALSRWVTGHNPVSETHKAHELTREWRDAEIDKVIDARAGLTRKQRDKRNFAKIG
ncbi:hypothetical protein NH8B_1109 [Pseudogulbenkiania sp. NH8B]|uniref:hypothetical protein n=1 Tax=Pseudogulbenkiania sp. (strain NH8B) TaxID=748280 RepID=UPI0002279C75|nr:hypothetical protein [Pseudogulbenkiania sp. NH8B]BAK75939.1 hypothetical protein NH8B_1109 [Pseudogulbenkiania sp. NH8B]